EYLAIAVIAAAVAYCVWLLFYRPFDFFRDFTELGFEQISNKRKYGSDAKKRYIINECRNRREIGDLPPVYPNGWFAILESDEVLKSTVKEVDVLGLNLVVWRGESGKCYVSDAYCPHLGAHLGVGGLGNFEGCSGKLVSIPNVNPVPPFANLKMWPVFEAYGFVYIWHHAENEEPSWWPDAVPEVESGQWKYRGRSVFRVACHIQEIPENGSDSAHFNVVHSSPFTTGSNPDESQLKKNFIKHVWSASWAPNSDLDRKHEALMRVTHFIKLFNKISCFHFTVDVHQIGPGIVLMYFETVLGKGILIQNVTPLEPMLQRVMHRFYSSPTFLHPIALLIMYGEVVQISKDIRIWNRKKFLRNPVFTKEDKQIRAFRRWYSQFYSENSLKWLPNTGSTLRHEKLYYK
ncbi:Cholesterol desaturase daf-36, partial [Orchesella cincta]